MEWIKCGWGIDFSPEFDERFNFHIDISKIEYTNSPLLEISNRVINEITAKYPEPYYLMVSGGIDSQAMLWCWMNSGKKFTPICIRYIGLPEHNDPLNRNDLTELYSFASNNNLEITYLDLDIISFLENELEDYATKYQCTSPQICTHMKMSELLKDGTVMFSGNFMDNAHLYTYTILGLKRYSEISGRNIIPFFFLHDNVLAGLTGSDKHRTHNYKDKVTFYKNLGIPIIPQPKKQTGFEEIKDYYDTRDDLIVTFIDKLKYAKMPSRRKFDILFRYRLGDKIKYQDRLVIMYNNSIY